MILAMKNKNKLRKSVLSGLVDAVKKTAIDRNCRENITETLVDEVLLKCKKMVQEMIDTCPLDRLDILKDYRAQMDIVSEFAPTLITDETEIRNMIIDAVNNETELLKANRGKIMKIIAPMF